MRKATVWTVKLVGKSTPMYIMTPGSSFYDLGDISTLLKVAADDAGLDKDLEIESIRKSCVAIGFTKLPNEGALALREDGTIKVNDPDRLAVMTGLPPETSSPFEGTTQTMAQQNAHDPEMTSAPLTPAAIARSVEMAPAILEAVDRAEKRRSRGPR